jgi:hypothetical protein
MTQTETELPAGQEGIDRAGIAQRLVGAILWPVETFESINRKPTWLAPLIIATVAMIFGNMFFNWRVNPDWEQLTRNRIMQRMRTLGEQVPPEQIEQQVATSKTIATRPERGVTAIKSISFTTRRMKMLNIRVVRA